MIENRMTTTKKAWQDVTAQIANMEKQLTALTTKRVGLASVYNSDQELLNAWKSEEAKPVPTEEAEVKVKEPKKSK